MRRVLTKYSSLFVAALVIGAFCVGLLAPTQSASALGVGSLSILPSNDETGGRSWFVHVMAEGEEKRDELTIYNDKDEAVTVLIFPTGYTTVKGKIVKDEITDPLRPEPGHWVELDETEVTVPSNSSRRVGFTIKVPENADVGEHTGGIFIQEISKNDAAKGTGVNIRLHIGARMVINIPGEISRSVVVSNIRHIIDYQDQRALRFVFTLKNEGNVAWAPVLDTELYSLFGKIDRQEGSQLQVVPRGATKDVESKWLKRAPYFGRFVAEFYFHLGEREQFNKDGTKTVLPDEIVRARYVFWLFPWAELIYLIVGVLLLYGLRSIWLYVVISRRLRTKSKRYAVIKHDTLTSIAAKFGVDPRVLAKFNMMRWPYEVVEGDELLIPIGRMDAAEWRERSREMLGSREILGGIFGGLLRRRNLHHLADRVRGDVVPPTTEADATNLEALVVEAGDTIQDIAEFAGVSVGQIAKINRLRPPYRLRAGQELLAPTKQPTKPKRKRSVGKRTQATTKKRSTKRKQK